MFVDVLVPGGLAAAVVCRRAIEDHEVEIQFEHQPHYPGTGVFAQLVSDDFAADLCCPFHIRSQGGRI
jgi:hypothetical protein